MSDSPEQSKNTQEHSVEAQKSAAKQLEKLGNRPEVSAELSPRDIESQTERARIEALDKAVGLERTKNKELKRTKERQNINRRGQINKKQREESYKRTINQVQKELTPADRIFSKIIHNKAIEKTSDAIGNTIARPNAMLSGAITAFVLTLLTYTVSKTIGYTLSGFETIAAFILGWVLGITYDYLRVLFTGKKF